MEKYTLITDLFVGIGNVLVFVISGILARLTIRSVQGEEHRHEEATVLERDRHEEALRLGELRERLTSAPTDIPSEASVTSEKSLPPAILDPADTDGCTP
jgi:hypothetical protein